MTVDLLRILDRLDESLNSILESEEVEDAGDVAMFPQPKKAPIPRVYISDSLDDSENAPKNRLVPFTRARKDYSGI